MASGALFGNSSSLGGSSGGSKHLVEFRAGRMTLKGRMVHPDKRKGFLYVYQGEDSLMHFCWKDRTTGAIEDDLLIFPDDCEFVRVNQCTTGRVYMLKFKSSRKYFFWMQEPKADKDEEYCRRINEALNNPPAAGSGRGGGGSGAPEGDLQNILNNMSQQQLMQLFGGVGQIGGLSSLLGTMSRPSTGQSSRASSVTPTSRPLAEAPRAPRPPRAEPAAAPSAPGTPAAQTQSATRSGPAIHLSDLQRYLSGLTGTGPDSESSAASSSAQPPIDLATALASPEVVAAATPATDTLKEHLPAPAEGLQQDDVKTTLLSPQFAQAASLFSNALTSGQLGPVVSQFGLGSEAVNAAAKGDVAEFFKALEKKPESKDASKEEKDKSNSEKDDKSKPEKDDDEGMSLD